MKQEVTEKDAFSAYAILSKYCQQIHSCRKCFFNQGKDSPKQRACYVGINKLDKNKVSE